MRGTHAQLLAYGDYYALSKQYGLHSVSSYDTRDAKFKMNESAGTTRAGSAGASGARRGSDGSSARGGGSVAGSSQAPTSGDARGGSEPTSADVAGQSGAPSAPQLVCSPVATHPKPSPNPYPNPNPNP